MLGFCRANRSNSIERIPPPSFEGRKLLRKIISLTTDGKYDPITGRRMHPELYDGCKILDNLKQKLYNFKKEYSNSRSSSVVKEFSNKPNDTFYFVKNKLRNITKIRKGLKRLRPIKFVKFAPIIIKPKIENKDKNKTYEHIDINKHYTQVFGKPHERKIVDLSKSTEDIPCAMNYHNSSRDKAESIQSNIKTELKAKSLYGKGGK